MAKLSPRIGDRSGFRLDGIEPGRVIWNEQFGEHRVETSQALGAGADWQPLPAKKRGFYNTALGTPTNQTQFFRLSKP